MQQNLHQGDSLYDMIKIKVHLDEHFYIFSRYLISRMLTLCRVRKLDAIQIAKAIKKQLIERNQLDIDQPDLQQIIFETMKKFEYEASIPKYQMVAKFYGNRTPMIILIFGAPCIGKSFVANALAERLNVSNVLQGDIVEIVMREIESRYFSQLEQIEDIDPIDSIVENYTNRCRIIRKGVSNDIQKCLVEGKPVIIEGFNLMPNYFLKSQNDEEEEIDEENKQKEINQKMSQYINNEIKLKKSQRRDPLTFNSAQKLQKKWKIAYPDPYGDDLAVNSLKQNQKQLGEREREEIARKFRKGGSIKCFNFRFFTDIEQERSYNNESAEKDEKVQKMLKQYQKIQSVLLEQQSKCCVLPLNLHNLDETLDVMHDVILNKIQQS